jgi:hypothetical protein
MKMKRRFTPMFLINDKPFTTAPGPVKLWGSPLSKVSMRAVTEVKSILTFVVNFNSINNKHSAAIKQGNSILKLLYKF